MRLHLRALSLAKFETSNLRQREERLWRREIVSRPRLDHQPPRSTTLLWALEINERRYRISPSPSGWYLLKNFVESWSFCGIQSWYTNWPSYALNSSNEYFIARSLFFNLANESPFLRLHLIKLSLSLSLLDIEKQRKLTSPLLKQPETGFRLVSL